MAHTCPDCGALCNCNADLSDEIDDTEEAQANCDHHLICEIEKEESNGF